MPEQNRTRSLLLVDHERLVSSLLQHMLESKGFEVAVVGTLEEAWRRLDDENVPTVLLNLTMPGAALILERYRRSRPLIVLASSDEDVALARKSEVDCIDRRAGLAELIGAIGDRVSGTPEDLEIPHVLVVDDDDLVRKTLANFLESSGYRISEAASGANALERVRADDSIAAILLDLNMPDVGGLETLAELKKIDRSDGVVMLSGISDQTIARRALTFGAFDYILKPPDFQRLESVISACISHGEYRRHHRW